MIDEAIQEVESKIHTLGLAIQKYETYFGLKIEPVSKNSFRISFNLSGFNYCELKLRNDQFYSRVISHKDAAIYFELG